MKYIFISSACPQSYYDEKFSKGEILSGQQAQKFNNLLIQGIGAIRNLKAVSSAPISESSPQKLIDGEQIREDDVDYYIIPRINIKVIRKIAGILSMLRVLFKITRKDKKCVLICDSYSLSCSIPTYIVAKMRRLKSVGIITDLPQFLNPGTMTEKMLIYLLSHYDGYVCLTKYIDEFVNHDMKPSIIIEGSCDYQIKRRFPEHTPKMGEKICVFSGTLSANIGLETFIQAFIVANIPNTIFDIYGDGELREYVKDIASKNKNIRYHGMIANDDVVEKQIQATLLINPRFSNVEFAKYSFPSKVLEYMVSGTPVLTTRLAGIPDEYFNYMYCIDGDDYDSFLCAILSTLSLSHEELMRKGHSAQEFVLQNKTNLTQGEKIVHWIEGNL